MESLSKKRTKSTVVVLVLSLHQNIQKDESRNNKS